MSAPNRSPDAVAVPRSCTGKPQRATQVRKQELDESTRRKKRESWRGRRKLGWSVPILAPLRLYDERKEIPGGHNQGREGMRNVKEDFVAGSPNDSGRRAQSLRSQRGYGWREPSPVVVPDTGKDAVHGTNSETIRFWDKKKERTVVCGCGAARTFDYFST